MSAPTLEIDLSAISHNARTLSKALEVQGIDLLAVTKALGGDPLVASVLLNAGARRLGDSRLENLARVKRAGLDSETGTSPAIR